ncbi:MAG: ATP-binding cassette domain-containing protein [Agathobacter sp.]|nr:ATP-binding cassette domain-containing protein [Agathobacter sp.]
MIKLENVSKKIRDRIVLNNISFSFEDGKIYGLKGINGSGKTMLMRMIAGLIYPTEGRILVEGKELTKDISFPEKLGLLLENPAFLDRYTGLENLKILAELSGDVKIEKLRETLIKVGLDPDDKRKYRKYSLGMKQRLGIAAAIMDEPSILMLDEPINALDADGVELFTGIIEEEKKRGTLIILSCHEEARLREYSDVIVLMEDGKIVDTEEK